MKTGGIVVNYFRPLVDENSRISLVICNSNARQTRIVNLLCGAPH